jgi:hypothetical protein
MPFAATQIGSKGHLGKGKEMERYAALQDGDARSG